MPLKGLLFICPFVPADPWTGRRTLWYSFARRYNLPVADFGCTPVLSSYSFRLYSHNIPGTRNADCHTCTWDSHTSWKSLNYSFLLDSPLSVLHYTWVGLIRAYGLCTPLPRLFLSPYIRMVFEAFVLYLTLSFRKWFVDKIWEWIRYNICIPTSCVLNYRCQVSSGLNSSFGF